MQNHRNRFFLYAGWLLLSIGMARFYYLHESANTRISERTKRIETSIWHDTTSTFNPEIQLEILMGRVTQMATNEVQSMIWPFLLVINGASFLLIYERGRNAEQAARYNP